MTNTGGVAPAGAGHDRRAMAPVYGGRLRIVGDRKVSAIDHRRGALGVDRASAQIQRRAFNEVERQSELERLRCEVRPTARDGPLDHRTRGGGKAPHRVFAPQLGRHGHLVAIGVGDAGHGRADRRAGVEGARDRRHCRDVDRSDRRRQVVEHLKRERNDVAHVLAGVDRAHPHRERPRINAVAGIRRHEGERERERAGDEVGRGAGSRRVADEVLDAVDVAGGWCLDDEVDGVGNEFRREDVLEALVEQAAGRRHRNGDLGRMSVSHAEGKVLRLHLVAGRVSHLRNPKKSA